MLIKRRSMLSMEVHEMEINVTPEQIERWERGMLIQDAMPHLTADEREFIKTGITKEEWDDKFGSSEEDDGFDVNRMHNGKRIVYQDSEGSWDELRHTDGRFEGFSPYRGTIPD